MLHKQLSSLKMLAKQGLAVRRNNKEVTCFNSYSYEVKIVQKLHVMKWISVFFTRYCE